MVDSATVSIIILIVLIAPTIGFFIGNVAINIEEYTKGECDFPEGVCVVGTAIGIPSGWLNTKNFLWFSIMPLIGVWLTVYGFMSKARFFDKGVMAALSFVIAFSTIPTGLFVVMVVAMYQMMSFYATLGLGLLFFVWVFFQVRGGVGRMTGEYAAYKQQIKQFKDTEKKTKDRLHDVEDALKKATDDLGKQKDITIGQRRLMGDEIRTLAQERESLKADLKSTSTQMKRFKTLYKHERKREK